MLITGGGSGIGLDAAKRLAASRNRGLVSSRSRCVNQRSRPPRVALMRTPPRALVLSAAAGVQLPP